jgi:hypothetical protein
MAGRYRARAFRGGRPPTGRGSRQGGPGGRSGGREPWEEPPHPWMAEQWTPFLQAPENSTSAGDDPGDNDGSYLNYRLALIISGVALIATCTVVSILKWRRR